MTSTATFASVTSLAASESKESSGSALLVFKALRRKASAGFKEQPSDSVIATSKGRGRLNVSSEGREHGRMSQLISCGPQRSTKMATASDNGIKPGEPDSVRRVSSLLYIAMAIFFKGDATCQKKKKDSDFFFSDGTNRNKYLRTILLMSSLFSLTDNTLAGELSHRYYGWKRTAPEQWSKALCKTFLYMKWEKREGSLFFFLALVTRKQQLRDWL